MQLQSNTVNLSATMQDIFGQVALKEKAFASLNALKDFLNLIWQWLCQLVKKIARLLGFGAEIANPDLPLQKFEEKPFSEYKPASATPDIEDIILRDDLDINLQALQAPPKGLPAPDPSKTESARMAQAKSQIMAEVQQFSEYVQKMLNEQPEILGDPAEIGQTPALRAQLQRLAELHSHFRASALHLQLDLDDSVAQKAQALSMDVPALKAQMKSGQFEALRLLLGDAVNDIEHKAAMIAEVDKGAVRCIMMAQGLIEAVATTLKEDELQALKGDLERLFGPDGQQSLLDKQGHLATIQPRQSNPGG
jgi:hypothetical protein